VRLQAETGFQLPKLRGRLLPEQSFSTTFVDTPDHRLAAAGITLQVQPGNREGTWRLDLPGHDHRLRFELAGPADAPPVRLQELVTAASRRRALVPVVTLRTERRTLRVHEQGREIADVVLDSVVMLGQDAVPRAFEHVIVERLDGGEQDLQRLTQRLRAAGALNGGAPPAVLRALIEAERPAPVTHHSASAAEQLANRLQEQYRAILWHDPGTRLGTDPESLHQHRVAVRRLRAILRAARPMLDREWVDCLRAELAWLGAALGPVRDLDVLLDHLEDESTRLPADDARAFSIVLETLAGRRAQARVEMLAALRDDRYLRLLDRLEAELPAPPAGPRPLELVTIAAREHRRLHRELQSLTARSSDETLHAARISVKRARYAAELAEASGGKHVRRYVKRAKRLQDVLGEHQDAAVAEAALRDLAAEIGNPAASLSAGIVVERQDGRRRVARRDLHGATAGLERAARKAWG
jgi:CHAD domain-containing protein